MDAITVKNALKTIVEAHITDITFSTKVNEVRDGTETAEMWFLLLPVKGLLELDDGVFQSYIVECALYQKMSIESNEDERDESLSLLETIMTQIFAEFHQRHIIAEETIGGVELSLELKDNPDYEVRWDSGENNENIVTMTFTVADEFPVRCSDLTSVFTYD